MTTPATRHTALEASAAALLPLWLSTDANDRGAVLDRLTAAAQADGGHGLALVGALLGKLTSADARFDLADQLAAVWVVGREDFLL